MSDSAIGMQQLFEAMLAQCASDLHLKAGRPPGLRVDGKLVALAGVPPLDAGQVETLVSELVTPDRLAELKRRGDLEFAYTRVVGAVARYRVSLVFQRGSIGAVLRRVPVEIPDLEKIGLPPIVKKLCGLRTGLVVVAGPSGAGKSTTVAAMIDHLNRECELHVLTMEDPIEYVHRDQRCYVTQREIGTDCVSFDQALRRALHHDPDVIVIGELRDRETIALALAAAETGHLVLATLPTPGACPTVDRLLDAFPIDERNEMRGRLASTLQGVVSQTLVNRIGGGRVAAVEVLVVTEGVRTCIRENKTHQIPSQMQTGAAHGMQTQATALAELVRKGLVVEDVAFCAATNQEEFRNQLTNGGHSLRSRTQATPFTPRRAATPTSEPTDPIGSAIVPPTSPPLRPSAPVAPLPTAPRPVAAPSILERLRRS